MPGPKEDQGSGVVPYALALVVCDAVWRDPGTGKRTILGCFSAIYARQFPVKHPLISVYAAITDGHGDTPLRLRLIDADENDPPLAELKGQAKFDDPRMVFEIDFGLFNVVFPRPGEYRLQLHAGSTLLIERRIVVFQIGGNAHGTETEAGDD